ncbi:MAG: hypothetical protein NVSMB29_01600 [Candidatus Dormibacteria bacterium]
MTVLVDTAARPRIALIWDGAADSVAGAVLRTLEHGLFRRLPGARLALFSSGATIGNPPTARTVRRLNLDDVSQRGGLLADHELVVLVSQPHGRAVAALEAAGASLGVQLVVVSEPGLTVVELAAPVQEAWFAENRRGLLRALGWLPRDPETPYVVAASDAAAITEVRDLLAAEPALCAVVVGTHDKPDRDEPDLIANLPAGRGFGLGAVAGFDEFVAAVASARRYVGSAPLAIAVRRGLTGRSAEAGALEARLDDGARAALALWEARRSPARAPSAAASRRAGTERAVLQCHLLAARHAAEEASGQLAAVVGSRSWRLTAALRAGRRRIGG